jgi:hypothetical protein
MGRGRAGPAVRGDQAGIVTEKNVQGAPALVIEILSRGTRKTDQAGQATPVRTWRRARVLARRSGARSREGVSAEAIQLDDLFQPA